MPNQTRQTTHPTVDRHRQIGRALPFPIGGEGNQEGKEGPRVASPRPAATKETQKTGPERPRDQVLVLRYQNRPRKQEGQKEARESMKTKFWPALNIRTTPLRLIFLFHFQKPFC